MDEVVRFPVRANRAAVVHRLERLSKPGSSRPSEMSDADFANKYELKSICEILSRTGESKT